ncbi:MAG: FAD-dependent oxidoreductase [Anaerolineaceae bacterium]|nr:MAG: FAD-dependent oxidoreductase [Anaerolineaceae bacterium]
MRDVMRDVVVVGGGLCGLAAAYELHKNHIPTTLIEVKPELGGSLQTKTVNGFIFDGAMMAHDIAEPGRFEAYLAELGIMDHAFVTDEGRLAFDAGNRVLIDALARRIESIPRMMRMAVSTLGRFDDGRFSICMENGMLLDARALVVAIPALYAERVFYTLTPEISYRLLDYRYDTITRVSVGYRTSDGLPLVIPPDTPLTEIQCLTGTPRTPSKNGTVIQAALRFAAHDLPDDPVGELAALMGWPPNPDADHIATWPHSDPAQWRQSDHPRTVAHIQSLLPAGVALANSDYVPTSAPPHLDERVQQGIDAARRIIAHIG